MPAKKEKFFVANGSLLQERLIATSNGRYNGFRIFSAKELKKATNNYDSSSIFYQNNLGDWYKGCMEGRDVAIFVPHGQPGSFHGSPDIFVYEPDEQGRLRVPHDRGISGIMNNIAMAARLSGHKNIAKLLGCCLDTHIPIVVYEKVGYWNLAALIRVSHTQSIPIPWKTKLKIASDIAHTIAYLHTAFSRPIIHRSIEPSNIFLDEQSIPRLSNFSKSTSIPEGKVPSATANCGLIPAYLPPELEITEKADVYCFGVLLIHLLLKEDWFYYLQLVPVEGMNDADVDVDRRLSPWPYLKYVLMCHSIDEIVDHMIVAEEGRIDECQQRKAFVELALRCLDKNKEERPTMVQVTKQLWQIQRCLTTVTEKERSFLEERSMILEKLIASCNDRGNVIHRFSAKDLKKATNDYSPYQVFSWSKLGLWYKGYLDERSISICKIRTLNFHEHVKNELQIPRAHENILKLLGCCLETPCPALVYESAKNGTLQNQIRSFRSQSQPLLWSSRLKIASQIADGIAHLHTAFSSPIIYRDLRLSNIFLDEHHVAKLSNFCDSTWIHEGEMLMKHTIMRNDGVMSSKFAQDIELSDNVDVCSFGLLLFHLLIGWTYNFPDSFINIKDDFRFWRTNLEGGLFLHYLKYYWDCHSVDEVVKTEILEEGELEQQQWQEVKELAFSCLATIEEKRPTMIEVAKQLSRIQRPLTTMTEKEKSSLESTRMFMEELIASYHGKHNSLCIFSAEKLRKATTNYRPHGILCCSNLGIWYRGYLGTQRISLCKIGSINWHEHVENEIKIAAQLSSHKNVLKLLGSCVETPIPILVYDVGLRTLFYQIHHSRESLAFRERLTIARQIADEIAELHSAFSVPIIHRNIKSANIFLDGSLGDGFSNFDNLVPKLSNFSQAISIREGTETLVTDHNEGTRGYMAPEYLNEGVVSVKVDVYSFGVLLIELLIGSKLLDLFDLAEKEGGLLLDHLKHFVTCHHVNEIVDPQILKMEGGLHQQQQWEAMIALACRCMETAKAQRPAMIEISRELEKI